MRMEKRHAPAIFFMGFRPFRGKIKTWHIIVESLPCVAKVLDIFNSYKSNNFH